MDIPTLKMKPKNAWNSYREYKKSLGENASQKDKAVMEAYKALGQHKTVINLIEAFKDAGVFKNGLPKLAIARADFHGGTTQCERGFHMGWLRFDSNPKYGYKTLNERENSTTVLKLPENTLEPMEDPGDEEGKNMYTIIGKAIVPTIPPNLRPGETMLKNYWILWEADWDAPPVDPILLKHLGDYLYAVVAEWDLTEVERSVLRRTED